MIKDLNDLHALLKICRKQGVTDITFGGVSVRFGDLPAKPKKDEPTDDVEISGDGLTAEQMMYFSVGGEP